MNSLFSLSICYLLEIYAFVKFELGDCCKTLDRDLRTDHCKAYCIKATSIIVIKEQSEEIANDSTEGQ